MQESAKQGKTSELSDTLSARSYLPSADRILRSYSVTCHDLHRAKKRGLLWRGDCSMSIKTCAWLAFNNDPDKDSLTNCFVFDAQ